MSHQGFLFRVRDSHESGEFGGADDTWEAELRPPSIITNHQRRSDFYTGTIQRKCVAKLVLGSDFFFFLSLSLSIVPSDINFRVVHDGLLKGIL